MYVVKFQGALGNQMFEWAMMCKLRSLYPDTRIAAYIPKIDDFNGYELEKVFGIQPRRVGWRIVMRLSDFVPNEAPHYKRKKRLMDIKKDYFGYKGSHYIEGNNAAYYPEVLGLGAFASCFLDGVWANAKYLEGIKDILLEEFQFIIPIDNKNDEMAHEMDACNSVCVHLRRNEYVTNNLSVASDNYYRNAIKLIEEKVDNPRFYVFSDDLEYCRNLFADMDHTLIDWNRGENSYRDMQLMTHCKHNIIANSTFSFWGAYLGRNEDKIVIAPNISWGDLKYPFACDDWIILDAKN